MLKEKALKSIVRGPHWVQLPNEKIARSAVSGLKKKSHYNKVAEIDCKGKDSEDITDMVRTQTRDTSRHGSGIGQKKTVAVVLRNVSHLPEEDIGRIQDQFSAGLSDFGSSMWGADKMLIVDPRPQVLMEHAIDDRKNVGVMTDEGVRRNVTHNKLVSYLVPSIRKWIEEGHADWPSIVLGMDVFFKEPSLKHLGRRLDALHYSASQASAAKKSEYVSLLRVLAKKVEGYQFKKVDEDIKRDVAHQPSVFSDSLPSESRLYPLLTFHLVFSDYPGLLDENVHAKIRRICEKYEEPHAGRWLALLKKRREKEYKFNEPRWTLKDVIKHS